MIKILLVWLGCQKIKKLSHVATIFILQIVIKNVIDNIPPPRDIRYVITIKRYKIIKSIKRGIK